jgi:hypothetical protein
MNTCAPIAMIPPAIAPAILRVCFCRDAPIVVSAVNTQVTTAVLISGHLTAV